MMILILSICLGASISGYADTETGGFPPIAAVESISEHSSKYDLNHKPVAVLSHSIWRRTASTSHRHLNYTRFAELLWMVTTPKQPAILQDFYHPDVYFKPIALKLVFPEHYFW